MRTNTHVLERIYKRLLREADDLSKTTPQEVDYAKKIASKLASASEGGIGLLTKSYGSQGIQIVLYKTNVFAGNILANLDPDTKKVENSESVSESVEKSVVGMIVLDSADDACNDAMVVKYVVSKEGFGPTLYQIAMKLSPSGRIMSDRKAVSDAATNVYKVLHQRGDVKKKELDDNNIPVGKRKTPNDPSDDCEVWNHKGQKPDREFLDYSFEGAADVNIDALKKNHEDMMKILKRHVNTDMWYDFMSDVANMMFMDIYHKIPMSARGLKQ